MWLNTYFPELFPKACYSRSLEGATRQMSQGCPVENLFLAKTPSKVVILSALKRLKCIT